MLGKALLALLLFIGGTAFAGKVRPVSLTPPTGSWCGQWVLRSVADLERRYLIHRGLLANLPWEMPTAFAVNHRYEVQKPDKIEPYTLYSEVPTARRGTKDSVFDFTKLSFTDPVPARFIIGDGMRHRTLLGVDLTPGSPLYREIERAKVSVRWLTQNDKSPDAIIKAISRNVANQMGPVIRNKEQREKEPAFTWQQMSDTDTPPKGIDFEELFVEHEPIASHHNVLVVPLEANIQAAEGYCLWQAIYAWILLRSLGIPSRPFFGGNATSATGLITGHTSVELSDRRIVDPSGWIIITPEPKSAGRYPINLIDDDWLFLPGYLSYPDEETTVGWDTWRFRYRRFLGVVLEP